MELITDIYIFYWLYGISIFVAINSFVLLHFTKNEPFKLYFSIFLTLVISIIIGLRSMHIGIDSFQYAGIYLGTYEIPGVNLEPMFSFVRFVFFRFFPNYTFFFIFSNILVNFLILLAFKKATKHFLLAMALFLSTFAFINFNINVMRQAYAVAFSFFAVIALSKQETNKYWLFMLLAILSHYTSLIMLIAYFIQNVKFTKKALILYGMGIIIFSFFNFSDFFYYLKDLNNFFDRAYDYFTWPERVPWHLKHIYYLVIMLIIIYFKIVYDKKISNDDSFLFRMYLYGFFTLFLFKEEEMVADRMFYYFLPIGILLIVNLKNYVEKINFLTLSIIFISNMWFLKTFFIQYPRRFMPPYEAIRHIQY